MNWRWKKNRSTSSGGEPRESPSVQNIILNWWKKASNISTMVLEGAAFKHNLLVVLHSGQLSHTHCTYSQNCVWKCSSKAGHFCLQWVPHVSTYTGVRFSHPPHSCTGNSDVCNTALVPVLSCMTPLHVPEPTACATTPWPGTPALLKSGQEDIHRVPKHKGAPLKAGLLRQSCHCHKSLSQASISWQGYLTASGPLTAWVQTNVHRGQHLLESLSTLQLRSVMWLFHLALGSAVADVQRTCPDCCGLCVKLTGFSQSEWV